MVKNSYNIQEITDKKIWENFNLNVKNPGFFQSWNMGEIGIGKNSVYRFGVYQEEKLIGIFQAFEVKARRGHFLHIRQGPVLKNWNKDIITIIYKFIKELAEKNNIWFVRISPLINYQDDACKYLRQLGFRESPIHNVDAENRWILQLENDEDVLFKNMRKTTRYMIRKAEGMSIKITRSKNVNDIDKFYSAYDETVKLKHFVPHGNIKEELKIFLNDNNATLYFAKLNNKILSSAMIVYYGKEAIYRHGGNTLEGRKTPASYLLQWEAIKDAKKEGLSIYNFWGIAIDDNPQNVWYGLSQFKKGFGGERLDFIHSLDKPLKYSYWLSFLIDYFTKIKRGYI